MMPVLFVSHGAPTLSLDPGETGATWRKLGEQLRPASILVISAHWETAIPTVSRAAHPETIHDFHGFPEQLYKLQYPAPGAPELARSVASALQQAGIAVQQDDTRGLDHGAWVPLSLMYPQADIPVTQLSLQPDQDPAWHIALGRALRPLREQGVLIIGSGAITHNLGALFRHPQGEPVSAWVTEFCDWIAGRIAEGDIAALAGYRTQAPHAAQNHPTDEHLLPLFVALGAADDLRHARRENSVMTYGILAMDVWVFDAEL
ncbi:MAG TPA: class III extradiol ring-cleavage dioxygenase [Gallionella sp.]